MQRPINDPFDHPPVLDTAASTADVYISPEFRSTSTPVPYVRRPPVRPSFSVASQVVTQAQSPITAPRLVTPSLVSFPVALDKMQQLQVGAPPVTTAAPPAVSSTQLHRRPRRRWQLHLRRREQQPVVMKVHLHLRRFMARHMRSHGSPGLRNMPSTAGCLMSRKRTFWRCFFVTMRRTGLTVCRRRRQTLGRS